VDGENSNKKISLCVFAETMEICSYLHVGKIITHRLQKVKLQYYYMHWKLLTAELLELRDVSPTAKISGFLVYQIHVEGIVLCF